MQRPLLYTYRRCPYAMRARMALLQAGIEFEAQEIVLRDKPSDMLRLSPKGTVPVLLLPGGQVVDESLEIMRWAFAQRDPGGWWARGQSPACRGLVEINDGPFNLHLDGYKYPERDPSAQGGELHRQQAVACLLQALERHLADKPFLGGDTPCAADLAIFPFVRQFRGVDDRWFDELPIPAAQQWLRGWMEGELFQRCMKRLQPGSSEGF